MTSSTEEPAATQVGPSRRRLLSGAAWALPAVAIATVAPVASASTTAVLTFDRTTYTGTVCAPITGAYVTVTTNGVAQTGTSVIVNTSTGYRFDNGASTFTGVSDASGRVSLPPIRVQVGGTPGTITATTTGATAAATLTASPSTTTQTAHRRVWTDTGAEYPAGTTDVTVPTGSRAVGTLVTLDPSGVLRRAASTIASGVTSAFAELEKSNYLTVTYVDASGMHRRMWTDTGAAYPAANVDAAVPANSVAVGTFVTLDPAGVLRRVSATIASGVNSAFAELDGNDNLHVTYVDATGMHRRVWTAAGSPYAASNIDVSVPLDSIAVGTLLTLGPDGVLRKGSNAVDTGVTSAFAELDDNSYLHATYVNGTGMHRRAWTDAGAASPAGNVDATVPADATAVGTLLTLDTTGTLRKGVDTIATGVTSAFGEMDKDNSTVVTWVDGAC
ncbi:hypothetical protein [Microbacterium sp. T32]|uniref:hypothetical protein n=1 Tax=Microbacterium sp. T32 TaxID=1776083 RepID=UPI0007AB73B2|nr:hypothetical protein [Microbacterium sp. T32]KZE39736.1 hypothetical protein AVW09_15850 [Microbacterium sp. T32]